MFFFYALYALYGSKKILTCPSYMPNMPIWFKKPLCPLLCPLFLYGSIKNFMSLIYNHPYGFPAQAGFDLQKINPCRNIQIKPIGTR